MTSNFLVLFSILLPPSLCLLAFATTNSSKQHVTPIKVVATLHPLVDGYCKYSWSGKWHCESKNFVCEGIKHAEDRDDDVSECVDRRIPEQMPQTGKGGRRSFRSKDGYYCKHKGFICVDGRKCGDRRTHIRRWEDDRLERLKARRMLLWPWDCF
jgi:hypothetical protein